MTLVHTLRNVLNVFVIVTSTGRTFVFDVLIPPGEYICMVVMYSIMWYNSALSVEIYSGLCPEDKYCRPL